MAKGKATGSSGVKMILGSKKSGKQKRRFGHNEEKPKKYKGQGR